MDESPLPTGVTTLTGKPVVGETLTCIPSGFSGNGVELAYEWLRDGAVIAGADEAGYELADADLGREVACRVTATNSAGDADSTSDALTVSAAGGTQGPAGPEGPAGPAGPAGPTGPAGPPARQARPVPRVRRAPRARRRSCASSASRSRGARSSAWCA